MSTNTFSDLKSGEVSPVRRVGHSFTNYFQSIDRSSFGLDSKGVAGKALGFGNAGAGAALNAGGNFLGGGGAVAGILTLAGAAAGSAAFFAAMAGPQVAVTAGVISVALLAKQAYSNREAAHAALADYCWTLVDTEAPKSGVTFSKAGLEEASSAALTLMDDGKNQLKLLGGKFETAKTALLQLNNTLEAKQKEFSQKLTQKPADLAGAQRIKDEQLAMIEQGRKPGGAIFNFVRRCVHTSNYMQAPHLIALAMREQYSPGSVVGKPQLDFFAGTQMGIDSRSIFANMEKAHTIIQTLPANLQNASASTPAPARPAMPTRPVPPLPTRKP